MSLPPIRVGIATADHRYGHYHILVEALYRWRHRNSERMPLFHLGPTDDAELAVGIYNGTALNPRILALFIPPGVPERTAAPSIPGDAWLILWAPRVLQERPWRLAWICTFTLGCFFGVPVVPTNEINVHNAWMAIPNQFGRTAPTKCPYVTSEQYRQAENVRKQLALNFLQRHGSSSTALVLGEPPPPGWLRPT